ncbi:MAG: hypothetical protein MK209_10140, partial [Planctomycetes bacterium]|nr:hypothetical protein [Planctomycetota bacterium]
RFLPEFTCDLNCPNHSFPFDLGEHASGDQGFRNIVHGHHLRIFGDPGKDRGCLTTDGVHLNTAGNQLVATASAQALREALERRTARQKAANELDPAGD